MLFLKEKLIKKKGQCIILPAHLSLFCESLSFAHLVVLYCEVEKI